MVLEGNLVYAGIELEIKPKNLILKGKSSKRNMNNQGLLRRMVQMEGEVEKEYWDLHQGNQERFRGNKGNRGRGRGNKGGRPFDGKRNRHTDSPASRPRLGCS
ncbi:uncharacterized protein LOC120266954 isoform X2 [Dioscorea cayenensis subsp. rotundata]|uniref:Uncharacterized protein LOC120266954 isoform X2 n=1 Tax=Dioscorea cayennensis subsp. rotundata TaxID=55577 RepID=A0AB40BWC8_DIOCR|nr:uncharacterized protein LOC120266954 isoform X2 [Dioscorea cayenensis subsp. rotundata]XP_039130547.1 uncharacterized protein LOC120266954 isoform X2 [Dioscorea cayenensis subsp. rotundata]XP_039130548.1 uncharacterized protein LOC120266954 isoform X2 [Dioscorea cayenensis subsp. rotundata]